MTAYLAMRLLRHVTMHLLQDRLGTLAKDSMAFHVYAEGTTTSMLTWGPRGGLGVSQLLKNNRAWHEVAIWDLEADLRLCSISMPPLQMTENLCKAGLRLDIDMPMRFLQGILGSWFLL